MEWIEMSPTEIFMQVTRKKKDPQNIIHVVKIKVEYMDGGTVSMKY